MMLLIWNVNTYSFVSHLENFDSVIISHCVSVSVSVLDCQKKTHDTNWAPIARGYAPVSNEQMMAE
jgi:hypothetical protein